MKLNLPLITGIAAAWGTLGLAAQAGDLTTMLLVPEGLELELGAPFEVVVEARLELSHRDLDQPLSTDVFANERKGRKELSALFDAPPLSEETLDYSWAILAAGSPSISFESSGLEDGSGVLVARSSWLLVSLEPGVRILPPMEWGEVTLESATELTVLGALEAGEDVPRPVAGFPDAPPLREAAGRPNVWIFVTPASLLLLLATLLLVRRGKEEEAIRRIDARHRMDTEMARLEALAAPESAASAEEIRTAHFALTKLVRESFELDSAEASERSAVGMTDLEWAEAVGASDETRDLLQSAGDVKYGGDVATCWSLAERLETAAELRQGANTGGEL